MAGVAQEKSGLKKDLLKILLIYQKGTPLLHPEQLGVRRKHLDTRCPPRLGEDVSLGTLRATQRGRGRSQAFEAGWFVHSLAHCPPL